MPKIKIIIPCWPSEDYAIQKCCRESIEELMKADTSDYEIIVAPKVSCYLSAARNNGVTNEKSNLIHQKITECDYYLFCDADTGFTFDNIMALIDENKPVIGGAYPYRKGRHNRQGCYCAGSFYPDRPGFINAFVKTEQTGVIEVDWIGGGFILARADALEKIEYPWFHSGVFVDTDCAYEYSEDIGFSVNCKKAGIPIYLHCGFLPKLIHEQDIVKQEINYVAA
jgi:glycosyltransferase involved in cell wall biosynthesis